MLDRQALKTKRLAASVPIPAGLARSGAQSIWQLRCVGVQRRFTVSRKLTSSIDPSKQAAVVAELKANADAKRAEVSASFFKTAPGQYGEGDQFLGVTVPQQRLIAKQFKDLPLSEIETLLASPWHEHRLTALLILVLQYERAERAEALSEQAALVDFYLDHLDRVNNWDLVDTSAPKILGPYSLLDTKYQRKIEQLAASKQLWRERVAVLATFAHIRQRDFRLLLKIADRLLDHPHDLIHKAIGWMLREAGRRDLGILIGYLDANAERMPRTMLRYAIEKLPVQQREHYLGKRSASEQ